MLRMVAVLPVTGLVMLTSAKYLYAYHKRADRSA